MSSEGTLGGLLGERTLATITRPVQVRVVLGIEATTHAGERQGRHGEDNPIRDEEIVAAVEAALPAVVDAHLAGRISDETGVLIARRDGLNVVGYLKLGGKEPDFVVATVMRKHGFVPKPGTWRVNA